MYDTKWCVWSRTTDTRWLNPQFFADKIQIQISNKYLRCGYKGLVFCRNNGWMLENMDHGPCGLTVPKWVLIFSLAENKYPKFVCPIFLFKPKSSGFQWKRESVVRAYDIRLKPLSKAVCPQEFFKKFFKNSSIKTRWH